MTGAFEGIRVVDLSDRLSGAWAARLFGDFGADVVLGEPPEGHALRREPPFLAGEPGLERSLLHAYANWNKRSVVVEGEAEVEALCANAHVVVTTGQRRAVPAGVVHLSITPHGLGGPLADAPGNNLTSCARVGWATINKHREDAPLQLPVRQAGYIGGLAGFIAAAAALLRGGGERIDLSETEALALTCAPWAAMGNFIGGRAAAFGPAGGRPRGQAGPLWRTRDGLINYGYGDWQQWTPAMRFLGLDELAEDGRFVSAWGRHQQDTRPVRDGLARTSAARPKWELFHGLAKLRCISGVVQTMHDLRASPQFKARGFIVQTQVDGASAAAPGPLAKLSETPWRLRQSAPKLGARGDAAWASPPARDDAPPKARQPLAGVRVLCFTQAWAGTFCTELLGLMGADVVQIETVRRPDVWRGAGAPVPPAVRNPKVAQSGINTNGMYNSVNLNKRAVTLDVTHPRGKAMFWRLVPKFDVLVDNFSPHVMTNWGVTLETLREHRPDIVFASVSGYGRQGPLAEYPANGATTEPMAGLASIHGYAGGEPMNTGGLIPDPISGYTLAVAILAALNHRKRTGVGQRIDAAMLEAVAAQVGDAVLEYDANGVLREPAGNRHPRFAPHGVYACAAAAETDAAMGGEWIAVAAETDAAFKRLAKHVGQPNLATDDRFATNAARKANEDALDALLRAWFAERDAAAEADALAALGVCAAKCEPFKPIYANSNPQFEARRFLVPVTHPESGTHLMPVLPWRMASAPDIDVRYSPRFGEHSREVFAQELGIGDAEYEELVALQVTGTERIA